MEMVSPHHNDDDLSKDSHDLSISEVNWDGHEIVSPAASSTTTREFEVKADEPGPSAPASSSSYTYNTPSVRESKAMRLKRQISRSLSFLQIPGDAATTSHPQGDFSSNHESKKVDFSSNHESKKVCCFNVVKKRDVIALCVTTSTTILMGSIILGCVLDNQYFERVGDFYSWALPCWSLISVVALIVRFG
jgi:hypothetical protein